MNNGFTMQSFNQSINHSINRSITAIEYHNCLFDTIHIIYIFIDTIDVES